ncbi:hypothetical protein HUW46_00974 [Amycolatopsis sp. CA-230715]|nr:hypothetical protein HUW46_00974 [Amycolatopsis sp. CA-230715]
MSRNPGAARPGLTHARADLRSGHGLDEAMAGAKTVVHCAGIMRGEVEASRNALRAAKSAEHFVYISIVGVDKIPLGYYRAKHEVEGMLEESGLGWTILRATQFHALVSRIADALAKSPLAPVPAGIRLQPVDAGEVADRLVALALDAPAGRVPDFGGPEVKSLCELVRGRLAATGRRRALIPVRFPGRISAAFRAGHNLAPDGARGEVTYEEFLRRG